MWIAEKFQSNSDIAGSPRNSFRLALCIITGGKALNGLGALTGTEAYQTKMPANASTAVRLWEISFIVKRETAQTHS